MLFLSIESPTSRIRCYILDIGTDWRNLYVIDLHQYFDLYSECQYSIQDLINIDIALLDNSTQFLWRNKFCLCPRKTWNLVSKNSFFVLIFFLKYL